MYSRIGHCFEETKLALMLAGLLLHTQSKDLSQFARTRTGPFLFIFLAPGV